jgi:hypothetical protein
MLTWKSISQSQRILILESSNIGYDWLFSNPAKAGLQPQRLKHGRAFAFSAYGRKFKPPAMRVIVDPYSSLVRSLSFRSANLYKMF